MGDILERRRKIAVERHPRSKGASLERLRALSGILRLEGKVPSHKFLVDPEPQGLSDRAGDRTILRR